MDGACVRRACVTRRVYDRRSSQGFLVAYKPLGFAASSIPQPSLWACSRIPESYGPVPAGTRINSLDQRLSGRAATRKESCPLPQEAARGAVQKPPRA